MHIPLSIHGPALSESQESFRKMEPEKGAYPAWMIYVPLGP